MTDWPTALTISNLAAAIRARQVSAEEVTRELLRQIEARNGTLRAFITVDAEGALREASACDRDLQAGRLRGPLHGVPLAHKDLCHIPGLPTSCGTKTPDYFSSERECTATARLSDAGALMLGKLNMAELAMGPFGDNAHHGDCQNPWRLGHVTGGSSSGSGCAVAAGLALGALGSDTGGSIRLPAACCGVVGLKPTWGRVSRAGAMALSWSMDHLGPLTPTVRDAGLMLQAIAGYDRYDATTSHRPVPDYLGGLEAGIEGLRLGVPTDFFWEDLDPEIERGVHEALETLRGLGARTVEIGLPESAQLSDLSNVVARAESAAIHQRVAKERPEDLQPAVRTRLRVGYGISAVDYLQAQRLRAKLTRDIVRRVFGQVDALVAPVIPRPAPSLEEVKSGDGEAIAERMGRFSRLTRPFNALGLPAMSVPAGFSGEGLPLAFQVVGRPFAEALVLRIGQAYESATDWQSRRPPG